MSFELRSYSGKAQASTLTSAIDAAATSFSIASGDSSSWTETTGSSTALGTSGKFVCVLDYGTANEEKVLCSSISGTTVTVTNRGYDGTSATSHAVGAVVLPVLSAQEAYESNYAANKTVGKISAAGDLLYGDAANSLTRLPASSNGAVMTLAGGLPSWQSPGTSGYVLQATGSGLQWTPSVLPHAQFDNSAGTAQTVAVAAAGADQETTLTMASTYTLGLSYPTIASNVVTPQKSGLYRIALRTSVNQNATAAEFKAVLVVPTTDGSSTVAHFGSSESTNNTTSITITSIVDIVTPINTSWTNKTITPKIAFSTIGSGSFVVPKNAGQNILTVTYLGPLA
jgi:hypothetical protein